MWEDFSEFRKFTCTHIYTAGSALLSDSHLIESIHFFIIWEDNN